MTSRDEEVFILLDHIHPMPAVLDVRAILTDLNRWGLNDYKIEAICGFSRSYVAQVKRGSINRLSQPNAARLWNFWISEARLQRDEAVRNRTVVLTTST